MGIHKGRIVTRSCWRLSKKIAVGSLLGLLVTSSDFARAAGGVQYISQRVMPSCTAPGQRTAALTQATVCGIGGTNRLYANSQMRAAHLLDRFFPTNRFVTSSRSAAELLFNDRTYVRFLSGADFTFRLGKSKVQLNQRNIQFINTRSLKIEIASALKARSIAQNDALNAKALQPKDLEQAQASLTAEEAVFDLAQGTVLFMNPPSSIATKVTTPQSQIEMGAALSVPSDLVGRKNQLLASTAAMASLAPSLLSSSLAQSRLLTTASQPSAIIIRHDPGRKQTQVFSLTNSGIRVSNAQGQNTKVLQGGEFVSIVNGAVSAVGTFDLVRFYQTTALANDLGPKQEDAVKLQPADVQATIWVVRDATLAAVKDQQSQFSGDPNNPIPLPLPPVGPGDPRGGNDGGRPFNGPPSTTPPSGSATTPPSGVITPGSVIIH